MNAGGRIADLPALPARPRDAHKGTAGRVLVVGGSCDGRSRMIGAPALAALGAFRAGAGLVTIAAPAPIVGAVIAAAPGATGVALPTDFDGSFIPHECAESLAAPIERADAIAVGMGLGPGAEHLALRCIHNPAAPAVVDADAINALAQLPDLVREFRAPCILTPHPGEFARLAEALSIDHSATNAATRPFAAEALAQRLGCVVVLKGAGTVVTDGHDTWVCPHGHPCLATAGTGDVLAGLLAGLCAQFFKAPAAEPDLMALAAARLGKPAPPRPAAQRQTLSLLDIARVGVAAHALAGERWGTQHGLGMTAADMASEIQAVLGLFRATGHP